MDDGNASVITATICCWEGEIEKESEREREGEGERDAIGTLVGWNLFVFMYLLPADRKNIEI